MAAGEELNALERRVEERYKQRTPKSQTLFNQAKGLYPDGDYRRAIFFRPYPTYMERAQGFNIYDVEGNTYIDHNNNNMAMVLGHSHPKVAEAIQAQAINGTTWAAPTENIIKFGTILQERIPSMERMRFACSGTEAIMFAIRATRAFTGRDKIMKMEGAYHGTYDPIEDEAFGVPKSAYNEVVLGKYNDTEYTEQQILAHKDELACVLLSINPGNPPAEDFLKMLRETTERHGIVYVLDEVVTFRLSYGGGQEVFNIRPDVTVTGKVIGGGMAVGAIGGREDIMKVFSPELEHSVHNTGTFMMPPLTVSAGLATLEVLNKEAIAHINSLGDLLKDRLQATLDELEIGGQASNLGSLVRFSLSPPGTPRGAGGGYGRLSNTLGLLLLTKGIFSPRGGSFALSTPMTEREIEETVKVVQESLVEMKPAINEVAQG